MGSLRSIVAVAGTLAVLVALAPASGAEPMAEESLAAVASVPVVPAFPGASGFGSMTPGGRGGQVLEVTSLADAGPGTLRGALRANGPRIVVFRVAGIVELDDVINVDSPHLTVAGQSAPGQGVTVRGAPIIIRTHDVVIRFLRVRPGDGSAVDPEELDGITILDDDDQAHDIVLDHVSATWSVDENLGAWGGPRDVTVQWSLSAEGLAHSTHLKDNGTCCDIHSMGFLIGPGTSRLSLHHNLFAHNNGRNPHLLGGVRGEVVNNVVYDWGYAGTEIEPLRGRSRVDVIGNVYLPGATSYPKPRGITIFGPAPSARVYVSDNLGPGRETGTQAQWALVQLDRVRLRDIRARQRVMSGSGLVPEAAATLKDSVLAGAGATEPVRDAVDSRIVQSVIDETGGLIDSPSEVGGYPFIPLASAPADGDHDGMPNAWETGNGLNPADPSDGPGDADADGYTNVEEYLNGLVMPAV